jgi:hypothetical protein
MEALLPLLAGAIAFSVAYLVRSFRRQAQMEAWTLAARRAGLCDVVTRSGSLFDGGALDGDLGELHVRLESYRRGKYEHGTRIVVTGLGHGRGGLSLRREGIATTFESFVGERETEIGDREFDRQFYIRGQAAMAFAALWPEARGELRRLLCGTVSAGPGERIDVDASLADGRLDVRIRESGFSSGNRGRVPAILARVLEVARPLVVRGELPVRIAANIEREPEAGVRLNALGTLAREFPGHPATRVLLRASLSDRSDAVRLRAATALGAEGRETLLQIVAGSGDDSSGARAVAALGPQLPEELAETTLHRALAAGAARRDTALACLEHLRLHGTPEAEPVVLEALAEGDGGVALAAARALGRIGTVASVAPLLEAGGRGHGAACRQAIAEIQSRIPGAGEGQLSIAGGESGALSLADGTAGQLSVVPGEAAEPTTGVPSTVEPVAPARVAPGTVEPDRSPAAPPPRPRLRE